MWHRLVDEVIQTNPHGTCPSQQVQNKRHCGRSVCFYFRLQCFFPEKRSERVSDYHKTGATFTRTPVRASRRQNDMEKIKLVVHCWSVPIHANCAGGAFERATARLRMRTMNRIGQSIFGQSVFVLWLVLVWVSVLFFFSNTESRET